MTVQFDSPRSVGDIDEFRKPLRRSPPSSPSTLWMGRVYVQASPGKGSPDSHFFSEVTSPFKNLQPTDENRDPHPRVSDRPSLEKRKRSLFNENSESTPSPASRKQAESVLYKKKKGGIKTPKMGLNSTVTINGMTYKIELIGRGKLNHVYSFANTGTMQIDDSTFLDVTTIVIRCKNPLDGYKNAEPKMKRDLLAYDKLLNAGVSLPKVYLRPDRFLDKFDEENGGFWIIEKMASHVSCEGWKGTTPISQLSMQDIKVLESVKKMLLINAAHCADIVNDFYPRNVMLNRQGELCLIDFSLSNEDSHEWIGNLYHYIIAWSNGNEQVFHYLLSDFTEDLKNRLIRKLASTVAGNGGAFPITYQTNFVFR